MILEVIHGCGSPSNNGWLDTSDAHVRAWCVLYRDKKNFIGRERYNSGQTFSWIIYNDQDLSDEKYRRLHRSSSHNSFAMKSHARRIASARKFRRAISRQPRVWFVRKGRDETSSKNKRKSSTRVSIVGVPIFTQEERTDLYLLAFDIGGPCAMQFLSMDFYAKVFRRYLETLGA